MTARELAEILLRNPDYTVLIPSRTGGWHPLQAYDVDTGATESEDVVYLG